MPTYEYECKECEHNFEAFQAMSDDPIRVCPECGKEVRRLILGGSGVIFKGSGFYVTDSGKGRRGSAKAEAKTEGASSNAAAAGDKPGPCGAKCPAAASGTGCAGSGGEGSKGKVAASA